MEEVLRWKTVEIEIWNKCNFNCLHCYLPKAGNNTEPMSQERLKKLLEDLAKQGYKTAEFTGYEPFLRPDLVECVEIARSLDYDIIIRTNGSLITKENITKLKEIGISEFYISLYSFDPKISDMITRTKDSLEKITNGIKLVREAGIPLTLSVPLMKPLIDFEKLENFIESYNLDYIINLDLYESYDHRETVRSLRLDSKELKEAITELVERFDFKLDNQNFIKDKKLCGIGNGAVTIVNASGEFVSCILAKPDGHIDETKLEDIIEKWKTTRKEIVEKRKCNTCEYNEYCNPCPALAMLETGDMFGCTPQHLEIAKIRKELSEILEY